MKYKVSIYSGTFEDSKFEFGNTTDEMPKTISWIKAPGFATIEMIENG